MSMGALPSEPMPSAPPNVPRDRVVDIDMYNLSDIDQDGYHGAWKKLQQPGMPDLVWSPRNQPLLAVEAKKTKRELDRMVEEILALQGKPFDFAANKELLSIPTARLVVIPDAGHSPQFENTDAWWKALTSFLQEVS